MLEPQVIDWPISRQRRFLMKRWQTGSNFINSDETINGTLFEAPFAAEQVLTQVGSDFPVVLFDCLTLYTANLLLAEQSENVEVRRNHVLQQADLLVQAAQASSAILIFVSNEVGMGIVPDNALSREYRDLSGWINQKVAAVADEVYLVVSGLAVDVKKLAVVIGEQ